MTWHLNNHTMTMKLDRDALAFTFVCGITTSGRAPQVADPCRVDYDEDGTATDRPLVYCNFIQWTNELGFMVEEILDDEVRGFEVASMPLPVAFRWDGDGYLWAPVDWAKKQGGAA